MTGQASVLQIFLNEADLWVDGPLYQVVVRRLRELGVRGATASAGIMGYGHHHLVHERGVFGMAADRPIVITAVDEDAVIRRVLPEVRRLVREGLVIIHPVEVVASA